MNADNLDSNTIASVFIGVHLRFQLCNFWWLCKGDVIVGERFIEARYYRGDLVVQLLRGIVLAGLIPVKNWATLNY